MRLSNRLAHRGGRRIPEATLERDYCLAWFLVGLSRSRLHQRLAFKGGTALKRCYFGDYRFSEDLDFTLVEDVAAETILADLEDVYSEIQSASGVMFRYSRGNRKSHRNSHTLFLAYEGPLPGTSTKEVKVDITLRERLVYPLENLSILQGYEEYSDLPADAVVQVYSLEEIAVEKTVALCDRARHEPRDLYDIWYLTSHSHVNMAEMESEIEGKLEFRGRTAKNIGEVFVGKEARYRRLWEKRLGGQMSELPPFESVFRAVRRSFRAAGLMA